MGILLIGSITKDTLVFLDEKGCRTTESLGGILYTTIAMATLTKEKIYPICNVGWDIYPDVKKVLGQYSNVDLSNLRKSDEKNIHCYIFYASEYGTQYDEGEEIPVSFEQIKPLISKSKFIFVSPMTGFDIRLSTFKKIKQNARCPLYFDYHILSLGRDSLGNRFLQKRDDWLYWCINCDYLQLNKIEAELLYNNPILSEADALDFSKNILNAGVKAVAITVGSSGAIICYRNEQDEMESRHIAGIKVQKVIDTTGCGDVFAAGFIVHFIKTNNLLESYNFANRLAGLKTGISGIKELSELKTK